MLVRYKPDIIKTREEKTFTKHFRVAIGLFSILEIIENLNWTISSTSTDIATYTGSATIRKMTLEI